MSPCFALALAALAAPVAIGMVYFLSHLADRLRSKFYRQVIQRGIIGVVIPAMLIIGCIWLVSSIQEHCSSSAALAAMLGCGCGP